MGDRAFVTYHLESAPLGGVEVDVDHVRHVEALGEPYRLEVELSVGDPDAPIEDLLGQDCVLEIRRGDGVRRVCGIVRHVEEGEHAEDAQTVTLIVVPALWLLGLRRNTKIFQEKTVPEIIEAVLGDALGPYSRSYRLELNATYPRREHCVQYEETDLDFVHRMMEEHGITYAFDHEGDREVMILRDDNASYPEVPSGKLIHYVPDDLVIADAEPIQRFRHAHHETTTSVVVRDWDWTRNGDMVVTAEQRATGALGRDRESYEHGGGRRLELWDYAAGARVYQQQDGAKQAQLRQELAVRDAVVSHGQGRVIELAPGTTFELTGHTNPGFDGEYLVTHVQHVSAPIPIDAEGESDADPYHNRFRCIPLRTPYRPARRAKKPVIDSIQTAVVTGPAGEEIHVDEHGRIKVQFHWDRDGAYDEDSSCWVRVQQPWSGAGWGFWYVPRIGMEVVVHFVDGDPDRPLVSGCVYNGTNLPPYPLPDEKTKSTIKSNSTPGGGGSNEFRYEDKAGSEEIYTHAQKDYNEVVENDHTTLVHHDQTITVDHDQTQVIGVDQTEHVHVDQSMTIDGNRTVHVKGDYDETVDGTETRHVVGDVAETFSSTETRTVSGNLTESIGANETRRIGASLTERIGGSHTLAVTGSMSHTITGSLTNSVTGGITQLTPATYAITAAGGLSVTAAAGVTLTAAGGIQIGAPGGVTHVDSEWNWLGVAKTEFVGFDQGATGFKLEFCGMAVALNGVQFTQSAVKFESTGAELEVQGSGIWTGLVYLKCGAFEIQQGGNADA